jgi:hypothetical protein
MACWASADSTVVVSSRDNVDLVADDDDGDDDGDDDDSDDDEGATSFPNAVHSTLTAAFRHVTYSQRWRIPRYRA